MNFVNKTFFWIGLALVATLFSCSSNPNFSAKIELSSLPVKDATEALSTFIQKNGDYINSEAAHFLIDPDEVYVQGKNFLILDIRSQAEYEQGHIDGAIRIERAKLMEELGKISPVQYDKVVIVDEEGFASTYAASVLRAAGFGNVYSLKFGMAAWNPAFSGVWKSALGNKYANSLETENHPLGAKGKLPVIKSSQTTALAIAQERAQAVLADNFMVTAEQVIADPTNYYIINYWPKDRYDAGHIPGAIAYAPKKSLKMDADLLTLPVNKKIVVYCYTGSVASAVTGYLRFLGYDAYALKFGANSFMFNTLQTNNWSAIDIAGTFRDYPLTQGPDAKSKKTEVAAAQNSATSAATPAPAAPAPKRQKKEAGGGGCG